MAPFAKGGFYDPKAQSSSIFDPNFLTTPKSARHSTSHNQRAHHFANSSRVSHSPAHSPPSHCYAHHVHRSQPLRSSRPDPRANSPRHSPASSQRRLRPAPTTRRTAPGTNCCARASINRTTCARAPSSKHRPANTFAICSPNCASLFSATSISSRTAVPRRCCNDAPRCVASWPVRSIRPKFGNACSNVRSIVTPTLRSNSKFAAFSNNA